MLASRTNWNLAQNQLALRLNALRKEGVPILDLSESNPTRCEFKYLDGELLSHFTHPANLSYDPTSKGMLEARRAIQNDYRQKKIEVDVNQILLTASTSEAYTLLLRLLVNPGDEVLVPRPSYPLFDFLARINDVELSFYRLYYDKDKWHIDLPSLISGNHAKTKAIILVHPNNPTGSFLKKDELDEIMKFAQDRSLALICDEVFSDYAFSEDPDRVTSLAGCCQTLSFTLGGISKTLGLPQMKLSWIAANGPSKKLQPSLERLEIMLDTYLSVNTPVQHSLSSWFSLKTKIQGEINQRIRENKTFLLAHHSNCLQSEGGWYAILRMPHTRSEEERVLKFLDEDHVYIQPGYFFDFETEAHAILSLLVPPETFREGILRILKRIEKRGQVHQR